MKVVIETKDEYKSMLQEIATAIKAKIIFEEKDVWGELPDHVKSGIEESQSQYEQGKYTYFSIVKEELLTRKHRN